MIKPTYLWALCKNCNDSKWIGDICRWLGGQEVKLDYGQQQVANMIKMDSDWMDERIYFNREAARKRQSRARAKVVDSDAAKQADDNGEQSVTDNPSRPVTPVTRDNAVSRPVTPVTRDNAMSRPVTPCHAPVTPSIHPSVPPSLHDTDDKSSDPIPIPIGPESGSGSESDRGINSPKPEIAQNAQMRHADASTPPDEETPCPTAQMQPRPEKSLGNKSQTTSQDMTAKILKLRSEITADRYEIFNPSHDVALLTAAVANETSSPKLWRSYSRNIEEGYLRQELFSFWSEIQAGEIPDNIAAALNARLKALAENKPQNGEKTK